MSCNGKFSFYSGGILPVRRDASRMSITRKSPVRTTTRKSPARKAKSSPSRKTQLSQKEAMKLTLAALKNLGLSADQAFEVIRKVKVKNMPIGKYPAPRLHGSPRGDGTWYQPYSPLSYSL